MWADKRIDLDACEVKVNLLPWQKMGLSYTATGYGSKIPTSKMVRLNNRWHRIYCAIYSNIGTCYVVSKGEKIIVH